MRSVPIASLAAALVVACGPGPTAEAPKADADAGAAAASSNAGPPPTARLTHNRDEFMRACGRREGTEAFCACAWDELRGAIGDAKMESEGPSAKDVADNHERVMHACKAKMPEEAVKAGFVETCVTDRKEMTDYCECSWTGFRKHFEAGDLADESIMQTKEFTDARAAVVKSCGPKISEDVVKEGFLKACVRDPKLSELCDCAWTELRKMASPAEIEAGMIEKQRVTEAIDKSCGKFKPKQ